MSPHQTEIQPRIQHWLCPTVRPNIHPDASIYLLEDFTPKKFTSIVPVDDDLVRGWDLEIKALRTFESGDFDEVCMYVNFIVQMKKQNTIDKLCDYCKKGVRLSDLYRSQPLSGGYYGEDLC